VGNRSEACNGFEVKDAYKFPEAVSYPPSQMLMRTSKNSHIEEKMCQDVVVASPSKAWCTVYFLILSRQEAEFAVSSPRVAEKGNSNVLAHFFFFYESSHCTVLHRASTEPQDFAHMQ